MTRRAAQGFVDIVRLPWFNRCGGASARLDPRIETGYGTAFSKATAGGYPTRTIGRPEPDIVRRLREQAPVTRAAYLAWGEEADAADGRATRPNPSSRHGAFRFASSGERSDLAPQYLPYGAGWLRIGIGSAANRKILIRVQGPTGDPDDDELLEAKEVANLEGIVASKERRLRRPFASSTERNNSGV